MPGGAHVRADGIWLGLARAHLESGRLHEKSVNRPGTARSQPDGRAFKVLANMRSGGAYNVCHEVHRGGGVRGAGARTDNSTGVGVSLV